MGWVKQSEDNNLPNWLGEQLDLKCSCGAEKENYYNEKGQCTNRRCPNKQCPETLAQKIAGMCDILKVKGVAEGTGRKLVIEHNLKSHFEAIPYIFKDKPQIPLYQLLRLTFVQGIDTGWESICEGKESVDDLLACSNRDWYHYVKDNEEEIRYGATFFEILKEDKPEYETVLTGTVMMSGPVYGLQERENLIRGINKTMKGLVSLGISPNKRKTGIMCLIQEKDQPNRGKAECAIDNGIPILTPNEFIAYVTQAVQAKLKGENLTICEFKN